MSKKNFQIGIALNKRFYWSREFGELIDLEESEPDLVIDKGLELSLKLINGFISAADPILLNQLKISGLLQFGGESIFLYEDEDMIELIKSVADRNYPNELKIYPFIHAQNDAWPEKDYFYKILEENFERATIFQNKAMVIHFNAKDTDNSENIFQKTLDSFLDTNFLKMVEKYKIKMCFENNHHMSYFGYPENILRFYKTLDEKLNVLGKKELIPYFSFCFDIGHFITQIMKAGRDVESEIKNFFDKFANRIGAFHLHTNSGNWDDHLLPLEYSELLIENKEEKYNQDKTEEHTEILWRVIRYWNDIVKESDEIKHIIFEIDHPYTSDQIYNLGKKFGNSLKP